jgi:hypothetical protein
LTAVDLSELASLATSHSVDVATVEELLHHKAARIFHRIRLADGQDAYQLGHDTLDERVIEILDPRHSRQNMDAHSRGAHRTDILAPWRESIHSWVEKFAHQGWPDTTPTYTGEA